MVYVEVAIIVALILLNGFLAMSELAVVSSRLSRLKTLQEQGAYGSRRALALASDPGRFLSSVQIGITLIGILSGAFSGATLGLRLSAWLETQGVATDIAEALGVGIVVALITYASLIVGELVPKQIALRNPEAVALKVAPIMTYLAKGASPLVWLLDASGSARAPAAANASAAGRNDDRRRGQDGDRRSRDRGRARGRRAPDDLGRDAARRSSGEGHHDAALGSRLDRLAGRRSGDPRDPEEHRAFAPAGRRRDRRHHRRRADARAACRAARGQTVGRARPCPHGARACTTMRRRWTC